jgi:hypothetical protein
MNQPKISIITVSYNHGEFIRQNIESVLNQNYPNVEHIIVDGGSTDDTVDILRSYPHLRWTSQSDRGQSDALNKGFARATGDIIGWLNSDDWYAPNIFHEVAQALQEYPVVLGAGAQTDRAGNVTEVVPNVARGVYDLWRYWIPYAWLAQPPIFFTRALLEAVKLQDGVYVDESFFLTMDYELWMRMAAKVPFSNRIDKVLAYYRIYDTNKTGSRPLATQCECSRVFRRHASFGGFHEQDLAFIVPFSEQRGELDSTLLSIFEQVNSNYEVLLIDCAEERTAQKQNHDFVLDLSEKYRYTTVRYERSGSSHVVGALNHGVKAAAAPLVAFLQPGDCVPPTFSLEVVNLFARDYLGLAVADSGRAEIAEAFALRDGVIDIRQVLAAPHFFPHFVARRLACLELGPFREGQELCVSQKEFLLRLFFRGWSIQHGHGLTVTALPQSYSREDGVLFERGKEIAEALRSNLKSELDADPFSVVRSAVRPYLNFCRGQ